jgi:hypothetical protein
MEPSINRLEGSNQAETEEMKGGEHSERRYLNTPVLVGKGRVNGGSIDVDFSDDALFAPFYVLCAQRPVARAGPGITYRPALFRWLGLQRH